MAAVTPLQRAQAATRRREKAHCEAKKRESEIIRSMILDACVAATWVYHPGREPRFFASWDKVPSLRELGEDFSIWIDDLCVDTDNKGVFLEFRSWDRALRQIDLLGIRVDYQDAADAVTHARTHVEDAELEAASLGRHVRRLEGMFRPVLEGQAASSGVVAPWPPPACASGLATALTFSLADQPALLVDGAWTPVDGIRWSWDGPLVPSAAQNQIHVWAVHEAPGELRALFSASDRDRGTWLALIPSSRADTPPAWAAELAGSVLKTKLSDGRLVVLGVRGRYGMSCADPWNPTAYSRAAAPADGYADLPKGPNLPEEARQVLLTEQFFTMGGNPAVSSPTRRHA